MNFTKTFLLFQSFMFASASCSMAAKLDSTMNQKSGIHYSINQHKKGRPYILFVHGTPGSRNAYKDYIENPELDKKYNMISIDRLGFGNSYSRQAVTTFKEHAKAILTFMKDAFPKQKMTCVGHSYGSPLCLYMMAWEPSYFNETLVIAGAYNHERKIIKWYNKWAKNILISKIIPLDLKNSNYEMYDLKEELIKLEKELPKVKSKVHLLHGKKDKIVPVGDSYWLKEKLSDQQLGKFIIEEKQGHFILWNQIPEIIKILHEIVK